MNHTLELPGLREDMARDFLASIGLLRLVDSKWRDLQPRLSWAPDKGFPLLRLETELPMDWSDQIVSDIQFMEKDPLSPLFHGKVIKAEYEVFRQAVSRAVEFSQIQRPFHMLPERMFAAYGGQVADAKTNMIEPSLLSFANNQSGKLLLRDVRELIRDWTGQQVMDAISGSGKRIAAKSFRWGPHEYRPAAYRAHDPGAKVAGGEILDIPALNILAFFGMSLLPTVTTIDGCSTVAFQRDETGWCFHWPIWADWLSVSEISALLSLSINIVNTIPGVERCWHSRRLVAEKSIYFATATPL